MKEKIAWAKDSLCMKWSAEVRVGLNQYPSHLTAPEGWKWCPCCSIRAVDGGSLARGAAVDQFFGFRDREGDVSVKAFCCYDGEEFLSPAYVASMEGGDHR